MTTIRATVKGRRLELDVPSDWPDGTEVLVQPVHPADTFGIHEELPPEIREWAWGNSTDEAVSAAFVEARQTGTVDLADVIGKLKKRHATRERKKA